MQQPEDMDSRQIQQNEMQLAHICYIANQRGSTYNMKLHEQHKMEMQQLLSERYSVLD